MPAAITGLQNDPDFADPLLRGIGAIDLTPVERCVVAAEIGLSTRCPDIKAFVCECHNLPPFDRDPIGDREAGVRNPVTRRPGVGLRGDAVAE